MARKSKKDPVDVQIEQEYYKQAQGLQINIMDIPKLWKDCKAAIQGGTDLATAMQAAIKKYCIPAR